MLEQNPDILGFKQSEFDGTMAKRGRRSAASNVISLATTRPRPRLTPPSTLNAAERTLFIELVESNPHLDVADTHFLAALAQAMIKANKLARKIDAQSVKSWEMTQRVVLSMATKLRCTQQATTHPEKAGRGRANANTDPKPWETDEES